MGEYYKLENYVIREHEIMHELHHCKNKTKSHYGLVPTSDII